MPALWRSNSGSGSSLKIECQQRIIFVYPRGDGLGTTNDSPVEGVVTLNLAKIAPVHGVSIRLIAKAIVQTEGRETKGNIIDLTEALYTGSEEKATKLIGEYRWPFAIRVPASAAPCQSVFDRGSLHYYLVAEVVGAGLLGTNLVAEQEISVIPSQTARGLPAAPLDAHCQSFSDQLGPTSIRLYSPSLIVGGLFRLEINLPAVNCDLDLLNVMTVLNDYRNVRHISKSGELEEQPITLPPRDHLLCTLDGRNPPSECTAGKVHNADVLAAIRAGDAFSLRQWVRLPKGPAAVVGGQSTRATTPQGTLAPLHLAHEIEIRLRYRGNGKIHLARFVEKVTLGVCMLVEHNVVPPSYSEIDETGPIGIPRALAPNWGTLPGERCMCSLTFEECLVLQAGSSSFDSAIPVAPTPIKVDGSGR